MTITNRLKLAAFLTGMLLAARGLLAADLPRVFFLNSYHAGYGSSDEIMRGLQETLTNKVALKVHFLDGKRQPTPEAIRSNAAVALDAIREFRPDVLVAADDDAVKYVVEPHFKHGPIPVVFCGVNWSCAQYGLPTTNVTGMIEVVPIEAAIREVQRHFSGIKKLVVLSEDSTSERSNRQLLDPLYRRLGLDPSYVLVSDFSAWKTAFVQANAEADIIYLPTNGAVRDWDKDVAVAWVRDYIRKPVITCDDFMMPYAVLGITKVAREQGDWAARTALGILAGKPPASLALATNALTRLFLNAPLAERLPHGAKPPAPRAFRERDGLVVIEAEHFSGMTYSNAWTRVPGLSGEAMKVAEGAWSRHLRYDIRFEQAGLYRLHVLGRKNPVAPQYAGNDLKVFFYSSHIADPRIAPGHVLFEIGFGEQKQFGWRATAKSKTVTTTDLVVLRPGLYRLYIVGGAGEEAGWELDRLLLTRDNHQPPQGTNVGPAESERTSVSQ